MKILGSRLANAGLAASRGIEFYHNVLGHMSNSTLIWVHRFISTQEQAKVLWPPHPADYIKAQLDDE